MANERVMKSPNGGTVPNPDPTARTIDILQRDVAAAREIVEGKLDGKIAVVETRLAGMDKAIELLQATTNKLPAHIKDEVNQLKELHDEKFNSIEALVDTRFDGIETQFEERDKRTEQLSLADKTAIAAALQAQKEAAGAQNESNTTANNKMEASFVKLIEQLQTLLQAVTRNTDDKINDIKSRLDKGEGKSSVSDPAVASGMEKIGAMMTNLATSRDAQTGKAQGVGQSWGVMLGAGGFLMGLTTLVILVLRTSH